MTGINIFIVTAGLLLAQFMPPPLFAETIQPTITYYAVTKVVDGDTFDVKMNSKNIRVRTIGTDTPEVVDPRNPVQCFGKEASKRAKELLSGKRVRLESDPTQDDKDKYGRLLRYAYLEDDTFFNKVMIEEGYAHEYTYQVPYNFQKEFKEAQATARENVHGLWAPEACNIKQDATSTSPVTPTSLTSEQSNGKQEATASADGHTWYLSSYHTSRFYYCDTDLLWQGLSKKYLKSFSSQTELLKNYPSYTLHEACK